MSTSSTMQHDNVVDDVGDVLHVALRHAGVEGQRYNSIVDTLRAGKIATSIAKALPIERMQMHGNEVDARADVAQPELLDEPRTIDRKTRELESNDIEVVAVASIGVGDRRSEFS